MQTQIKIIATWLGHILRTHISDAITILTIMTVTILPCVIRPSILFQGYLNIVKDIKIMNILPIKSFIVISFLKRFIAFRSACCIFISTRLMHSSL